MKMLGNSAYTKERKLSRKLPFTLERSAELSVIIHTMKKSIHKVSDGQISIRFPCFLVERT